MICVGDVSRINSRHLGRRVALVSGDGRPVTFAELNERSNILAALAA